MAADALRIAWPWNETFRRTRLASRSTDPVAYIGFHRLLALRFGVLAIAMCANTTVAQEIDQSATTTEAVAPQGELESILIEDHYDTSIGNSDAASQGTVNGVLLRVMPLLRPGEALETVPGLVVTQHSGDGKANQYFLRGYNLDHGTDFATSVDGVPVNMPTNAHGQGYSDLNFLIPELVERIDYYKGPYFAQFGNFSAAGAADIWYRKSLEHSFADLTVGAFEYRRALLAGSTSLSRLSFSPGDEAPSLRPNSDLTVLGSVELEQYDGPWTVPENLRKINSLLCVSEGDSARGWSTGATYYDAGWNSTDQVPLSLIESGRLGRFSALDPTDGGGTGRDILSGEWHNRDTQGYTKVLAYLQRYRLDLFSNFSYFELRPATGDQFEQWEKRDIFGGQIVEGRSHSVFGHESTTEIGTQFRHDNIGVGLNDTHSRIPFATVTDDEVSETATAIYIQNSTAWTGWFRSLVGLREQVITMSVMSLVIPENTGSASGSKGLPKLSLIFGPWFQTQLFLNWGKGFHSNDARGVIERIDPTTLLPVAPVPTLVGATGKEFGVRTEAIQGLQSSLALWSLNSNSELVYNADSDIGSTSPNGASTRYGVEWNNHFMAGGHLFLDADLAWTHARYTVNNDNGQSGDFIPNAVAKVGLLRASLEHLGPWSVDIEARFIGAYPLSQDGTLTTPSSTVVNMRIQREFSPHFGVALDVLNVLDRQYFDIAYEQDYRISPTSLIVPDGVTVHPGEPRELRLTLKIKF